MLWIIKKKYNEAYCYLKKNKSLKNYVLAQNPDMSIMECISESKHMMEGKKMNYFLLHSFLYALPHKRMSPPYSYTIFLNL